MHTIRPALPDSLIASVTETLAHWLPSGDESHAPRQWGDDEWLAAEWVAYWQNAIPWLHARVGQSGIPMPEVARQSLSSIAALSRQRTHRMLDAAAELMSALHAEGVEALPFKGALLAPLYYSDPASRPLADLDILVRERDVRKGINVLERLGYSYYSRSAEDFVYLRGERQPNVWRPDNVQPVELHFRVREEYAGLAYDLTDALWASAQTCSYWGDTEALIPAQPIMLHHLCAHTTSDLLIQRGKLMELGDLEIVAARMQPPDWEAFLASIPASGARFVYPALAVVERYAPGSIPMAILSALRVRVPLSLREWSESARLADASESNPHPRSGIGLGMARLLARSRVERIRMWLRSLFPRRWNLVKRYPRLAASPLYPMCYVLINLDRAWHILGRR
ncbi:MAG TPA: nucleotidyltransferase family protein [Anaerolineae bacterium]|nr:nucleotidyltransferase family protein [Anaerolineae bacterium]